jgi:DNA-binding PadR family transcriptional regulator
VLAGGVAPGPEGSHARRDLGRPGCRACAGLAQWFDYPGYALREAIREVLGHFWSESFGQIYPMLANLERQCLVKRRGSSRPGSSTFAITASGRARLTELLGQPIQPVPRATA